MRVLLLSPEPPYPAVNGARIRMQAILRVLSDQHTVDVLTLGRGPNDRASVEVLGDAGQDVELIDHVPSRGSAMLRALSVGRSLYFQMYDVPGMHRAVSVRLSSGRYDVVLAEFAYMGQYCGAGLEVPWVLDEHNVEFELSRTLSADTSGLNALYRWHAARESRLRRREELAICGRATAVTTVSAHDRSVLLDEQPGMTVDVAPNGVDLEYFQPRPSVVQDDTLAFVGKMDYRPNVEAVCWFVREILPSLRTVRPSLRMKIIGSQPTAEVRRLGQQPGVDVIGAVADTRPHIADARVVVIPIRSGSGTRLKVLEGMAMGRPVVSTSLGCRGLDVEAGRDLLVADDARAFSGAVLQVLESAELAAELGARARKAIERRYSWQVCLEPLVARLEQVAAQSASARGAV